MHSTQAGSDTTDADRAPIRMTHDTPHLTISQDEAARIDEEAKKRLLAARKLSLVVDLDQTIIHAAVDPTIAEWQRDKDNPNHDAVKDVRAFQLVEDGPGMRGCWYYIKLRPGLTEFLENIAQLYELHIYTMGTRQYAQQIANIVDPDRKYFGERILSRDESGSMVAKNLERLFPVDTKMVVIIDDRGDVWKWSTNLIRVTPFDFFVGIGDINSSFLPKKQEIQSTPIPPTKTEASETVQNGEHDANELAEDGTSAIQNGTSALEQLVAMSGGDDPVVRDMQSKGQEEAISSQLEDKPLLKMQQAQDEKDEAEATAAGSSAASSSNGDVTASQATESDSSESSESSLSSPIATPKSKARHSILKNDDEELIHLEARLTAVHAAFYNEFDRKRSAKGGRVAALAGKKKPSLPTRDEADGPLTDLSLVPDVKKVMPAMKMRVLSGVTLVFSGVLPLGTDIQNADISTWAKTFGAAVTDRVTRDVTHVIAARAGTAKVKQAVKRRIKVVGTAWLIASIQQWRKLDERPYLLEGTGKPKPNIFDGAIESPEKTSITAHDFLLSSSEGETTGFDTEEEQPAKKRLKLDTGAADGGTESETDLDGEGSPITINQDDWADMDAELKEFMGSEADTDSDTDSVSSSLSFRQRQNRKRRREDVDDEETASNAELGLNGKRTAGGSGLKTVQRADTDKGALPTATPIADEEEDEVLEEQKAVEDAENGQEAEEYESDDELGRELERELENEDAEDAEDAEERGTVAGNSG